MRLAPPLRVTLVALALAGHAASAEDAAKPRPQPWQAWADPAQAGYSAAKLEEARAHAEGSGSAAVVAVYRGKVLAAWGAVERPLMVHSVRKSLAGALYGIAIEEGVLSPEATLAQLGVDDDPPLTDAEKRATFGDLVRSRSGVYHGAAYADASQERERPPRGTQLPGALFVYNNWDFNVAEAIYARRAGEDLYTAFDRRVARPLGMEDFDPASQVRALEPSASRHPAHTFRVSARDLARFGELYRRGGRWDDRQIVPERWVRESLRIHSPTGKGSGYGQLWWTYEAGSLGEAYPSLDRHAVHLARGTGGQTIFVVPGAELVVVHLADTDHGRSVKGKAIWQLVERILAARVGSPAERPALAPVRASPFASALSPPPPLAPVKLAPDALGRLAGTYELSKGGTARVFLHEGRLFVNVPGEGEAELVPVGPLSFRVPHDATVRVEFREAPRGAVAGVDVRVGDARLEAVRR